MPVDRDSKAFHYARMIIGTALMFGGFVMFLKYAGEDWGTSIFGFVLLMAGGYMLEDSRRRL